MSRRDKERRGYQLVVVGGVSGVVAVVSGVLAILTAIPWTLPFVALIVAVICVILFRRLVGPSR